MTLFYCKKSILLLTVVLFSVTASANSLSLDELQSICSKKKWEEVNQYLTNKGWEYESSKKGSSTQYNLITWSFNKNYNGSASNWLKLFTYVDSPT